MRTALIKSSRPLLEPLLGLSIHIYTVGPNTVEFYLNHSEDPNVSKDVTYARQNFGGKCIKKDTGHPEYLLN